MTATPTHSHVTDTINHGRSCRDGGGTPRPHRWWLPTVLALWAALAVTAGATGALGYDINGAPVGVAIAAGAPIVLFLLFVNFSCGFAAWVRAGDPVLLTLAQTWRVIGLTFLVLLALGQLPAGFAIAAGVGDIAVGVGAIFVIYQLFQSREFLGSRNFIWFHVLGLLDFVVAIGSGATTQILQPESGMHLMGQLPLALIPGFLVPIFAILHIAAIMQARAQR